MPASPLGGIVACPRCFTKLVLPQPPEAPVCGHCGEEYRWDAGVPDLTPLPPPPGQVADRWALWEELQANGAAEYEAQPAGSLSVGERVDARLFGAFAELRGNVLDVGCGPQERPSYAPDLPGFELFGIDPLRGVPTRGFAFVRGLGEYLPFASGSFDRVLFGTSLDHLLDPARALRESVRVLAPGGRVVVWVGLQSPGRIPRPLATAARGALDAARKLRAGSAGPAPATPEGAVDAYHFAHPGLEEIEAWLALAGLRVVERARLSEPTSSVFMGAVPR
jgi:SAM-dependent methyltransferase